MGRPGCVGYALERLAEMLLSVAGERAALIGHSWGGAVALSATAARPKSVSAVVLLDSGHFDDQRPGGRRFPTRRWRS